MCSGTQPSWGNADKWVFCGVANLRGATIFWAVSLEQPFFPLKKEQDHPSVTFHQLRCLVRNTHRFLYSPGQRAIVVSNVMLLNIQWTINLSTLCDDAGNVLLFTLYCSNFSADDSISTRGSSDRYPCLPTSVKKGKWSGVSAYPQCPHPCINLQHRLIQ